jgi:hypothetical protein
MSISQPSALKKDAPHCCRTTERLIVTVDYYGPLPESRSRVSYIFAVIESFSKFVKLYPLRRAQARKLTFSTVRHPQSNPTERVMRELRQLFQTYCQNAHANWTKVLSKIELLFNVTPHISTGYSSYEILLGKNSTNRLSKLRGPLLPAVPLRPVDQIRADLVKFYHRRA